MRILQNTVQILRKKRVIVRFNKKLIRHLNKGKKEKEALKAPFSESEIFLSKRRQSKADKKLIKVS